MSDWAGEPFRALLFHQEEDRFTEYLCQLLRSPEALGPFLESVCKLPGLDFNSLSVQTQVQVPGGRPDLVIRNDSTLLLFEAKISAELSSRQLVPYAQKLIEWKQLHPEGTAGLFLITAAVNSRYQGQQGTLMLENEGIDWPALEAITWEEIAQNLGEIGSAEPRLAAHLTEFRELVSWRFGDSNRPFTAEECRRLEDGLLGGALNVCERLTDEIAAGLHERGFTAAFGSGRGSQGYVIRNDRAWWWVGIWFGAWARAGGSPLVFHLSGLKGGAKPLPEIPEEFAQPVLYSSSAGVRYVIPLVLRPGVSLETLKSEFVETIASFCTAFPQTGGNN